MEDIELTGSQEVLDELQSGRTRELLLLLQDKPVPEVQDPMNVQDNLSDTYIDSDGYIVGTTPESGSGGYNSWEATDGWYTMVSHTVNGDAIYGSIDLSFSLNEDASNTDGNYRAIDTTNGVTAANGYWGDYSKNESGTYDPPSGEFTLELQISVNSDSSSTGFSGTYEYDKKEKSGYVTDQYTAPTTAPTDFKQWVAIRAVDVTTSGSTSANPVEFEILDSSDTVLTSSRIPSSEMADSAFHLRDREWQTTASAGQTAFTIPETGAGGHYGIPILSVVTVEQNGSILDGEWGWDGVDTVTLDSGASDGDTITVTYDLDVFDSTLQPRAYLSRESASENSPSISHFRYEYVI